MSMYVLLDLKNFHNHKAIVKKREMVHEITLDRYGLGDLNENSSSYFFKEEGLPGPGEITTLYNTSFYFPKFSANTYDNISCEEQVLKIPGWKVSAISFLGFSTSGNFSDDVRIVFTSHEYEDITIDFLDWYTAGKANREDAFNFDKIILFDGTKSKTAFQGKALDETEACVMFLTTSICNNNKPLSKIILPGNPYIHIFSITLEIDTREQKDYIIHTPYI